MGAKVNLQKLDHQNKKKKINGQKGGPNANGEENEDGGEEGEEEDGVAGGNGEKNEDSKEGGGSSGTGDNEKIKMNLKNSSKIYYSITHTIQEEIKE